MTITESSPNTLDTTMGASTVNDYTLLHTPRFYSQYPVYHYPKYHEPQYVPPLQQLPQLPKYVPWLPQQHQYVNSLPTLPSLYQPPPLHQPPQLPQHIPWFPQQPQYVPYLPQLSQLPQYVPDGYYCEIQYVSPQIVSKSNSSHSSPHASSQPPQTQQDDLLAVSM